MKAWRGVVKISRKLYDFSNTQLYKMTKTIYLERIYITTDSNSIA